MYIGNRAVDGDTALAEIANHGVDRVRLGVDDFRPSRVVKQQSLWIGFMRPAETALNIGAAVSRQADSGLVPPDRAP
jgi:hypothetical protein